MNKTFKDQLLATLEAAVETGNLSQECMDHCIHCFDSYRQPIIIEYYVRNVYGRPTEYVLDGAQRQIIMNLTRQKTIDSVIRELLRDLTGGAIIWKHVLPPGNQ